MNIFTLRMRRWIESNNVSRKENPNERGGVCRSLDIIIYTPRKLWGKRKEKYIQHLKPHCHVCKEKKNTLSHKKKPNKI